MLMVFPLSGMADDLPPVFVRRALEGGETK
jgi:hypothetical protein